MRITLHNYEAFLLDYLEGQLDEAMVEELRLFAIQHPELEIDLQGDPLPVLTPSAMAADFKEHLKKQDDPLEDEDLLDYLEGLMSGAEKRAFEARLAQDPSLSKKLHDYRQTVLSSESQLRFEAKETLLKGEEDLMLKDEAIAYVENVLNAEEKALFETRLKQDAYLRRDLEMVTATKLTAETQIVFPNKERLKKKTRVVLLFHSTNIYRAAAALLLMLGLWGLMYLGFSPAETGASISRIENSTPFVAKKRTLETASNSSLAASGKTKSGNEKNINESETGHTIQSLPVQNVEESELASQQTHVLPDTARIDIDVTPKQPIIMEQPRLADGKLNASAPESLGSDTNLRQTQNITELALVEEWEEQSPGSQPALREKGLWKRAVQLARQANKLGVKSVDGVEDTRKDRYRISFNSFSVEKK